jgi:hypothetical protein
VVEDEEELCELVERLVPGPQWSSVTELLKDPIAHRVDCPDAKLGQIALVADLASSLRDPVAELERRLLSNAAFSVNVHTMISAGSARLSTRRLIVRRTSERVLPEPGPAMTSKGPSSWPMMACLAESRFG